jgi:Zn-dependent M28 family amino/carboxypeptidase
VEISNIFAALENLDERVDINNAWKSIRDDIKTSTKENLGYRRSKHNKPRFDDVYSKLM